MTIKTLSGSVAVRGAGLLGVCTPWANLPGTGVQSALPQIFSPVAVTAKPVFVTPPWTAELSRALVVMTAGLPIDIRKQYVHKTRVNAGGDGASGPHPEREPA